VLTFEHEEATQNGFRQSYALEAGGIGWEIRKAIKKTPQTGDKIMLSRWRNYRIGMGGAAVSSADTGAFSSGIELNAIQRSNPEMQNVLPIHPWLVKATTTCIDSRSRSWRTLKLSFGTSGRYWWIN
jgi:phosphoribosylformylglycinamidine (FGAM) synthase-like enzyme